MTDEPSLISDQEQDPQEPERTSVDPAQLPGRRLRAARERRQWSVNEVAERLRLHPSHVAALENDDYAPFAAPIFVHGYLRNYARLLGLEAEPLVAASERQGLEEPPILSELTSNMPTSRRRLRSSEGWAGLLIAASLGVLVVLWLGTRAPSDVEPVAGPEPPPPPALASEASETVEGESETSIPTASRMSSFSDTDESVGAMSEAQPGGQTASAGPVSPPTGPPTGPMDELLLRFTGDSWVEIADVSGRRLMYRMGQAGQEVHLRGLAPFDILLGNAPVVTIEYNGEPYKDIPISQQNVASFRLGIE